MSGYRSGQEWFRLTEPERVVAILREVGIEVLGNWDGCCCSNFSIRNVNVDISCGKGRKQGVWVWSRSSDYDDKVLLIPIMDEVLTQANEKSGRFPNFEKHYEPYNAPSQIERLVKSSRPLLQEAVLRLQVKDSGEFLTSDKAPLAPK